MSGSLHLEDTDVEAPSVNVVVDCFSISLVSHSIKILRLQSDSSKSWDKLLSQIKTYIVEACIPKGCKSHLKK